jgi:sigma-B regulation protein RsbU (phosphoserine phosphatase)
LDKQGSTKILVVDDDPFVREMLATILQSSNYDIETAEDGIDALKKYSGGSGINLIISDMNMPEMKGLELIKKLRHGGSDVPIIILTGNNEIAVAIDAMNSGANDYILKDENIQDTVILSVEKVLEKDRLKKQNLQLMADLAIKNERLEKERMLASKVQKNILPSSINLNGFDIGTFYRPSDKIGGDFYDAWETVRASHFIIGDVSGHGIASALLMAACKGMLNSLGQTMHTQLEIITATNRMLCDILSEGDMFLSLIYASFIKQKNEIHILSAGHNPVFLMNGKDIQVITSTGPVMGWDHDDYWEISRYQFNPGDSLFLYTDGLTEAKNSNGEEFGETRLQGLFNEVLQSDKLVEKVFKEVSGFCTGNFYDDLTMFMIKRDEE